MTDLYGNLEGAVRETARRWIALRADTRHFTFDVSPSGAWAYVKGHDDWMKEMHVATEELEDALDFWLTDFDKVYSDASKT